MKLSQSIGLLVFTLGGCVQPYMGPAPPGYAVQVPYNPRLSSQDQTASVEEHDRIERFQRLASLQGISPPTVMRVMLPSGSVDFMSGPVPVVRVTFSERAFFAFDSATPMPGSERILDVIAENMRHDVPDAALTILGHTDAIGTDAYNIDLSRRRAEAVMRMLSERGVPVGQMSEVAIGRRQPIAPNDTAEGRATNRRVEFLISPALNANLAAVQQYVAPKSYFVVDRSADPARHAPDAVASRLPTVADVFQLKPSTSSAKLSDPEDVKLRPLGGLPLSPPSPQQPHFENAHNVDSRSAPIETVGLKPTMPVSPVKLIPITPVEQREVDPSGSGLGTY